MRKFPTAIVSLALLLSAAPLLAQSAAPDGAMDSSAVESGLRNADFRVRRQALRHLGSMEHPRRAELLRELFADEDPEIRERAARFLGRSGAPSAYAMLTEAVVSTDTALRLGAIDGLRDLGDARAAVPLAALLTHKHRNTRWKAAVALGVLGSDDGVAALRRAAAEDGDEYVRKAAVAGLGRIGTVRARRDLNALKAGKDKKSARWAENVLKAMGGGGR